MSVRSGNLPKALSVASYLFVESAGLHAIERGEVIVQNDLVRLEE